MSFAFVGDVGSRSASYMTSFTNIGCTFLQSANLPIFSRVLDIYSLYSYSVIRTVMDEAQATP